MKMDPAEIVGIALTALVGSAIVAGIVGWCMNIAKILFVLGTPGPDIAILIVRCLGVVFPPIGAVAGWV